ncbi:hypothetical protein [Laspinema olomoucense]|uniref:hypothetical protein n=1 Tax=Laspinema olomoucense TaxID=3231600 RepID=UPI0021BB06BA|nr:hypothetical protein [Laspinema sp. D3d]MCT7971170.1 hypothetical protein [Laspinema sp. D3d]
MFNFPWPNAPFSRITGGRLPSGHPYPITREQRLAHQLLDDSARWGFLGSQFIDEEIMKDIIFADIGNKPYYVDYTEKSVSKWQKNRCMKLAGRKLIPGQKNYAFYFEPESEEEPETDLEMIEEDLAPDGYYYYY